MIELSTAEYFQTLKHVSIEYDVSWYIQEHLSSNCEQSMKMIFNFLFGRSAGPECAGRAVCEKHYWGHEHESASAAEMGTQKVDGYDDCHDGYEFWLVLTSSD